MDISERENRVYDSYSKYKYANHDVEGSKPSPPVKDAKAARAANISTSLSSTTEGSYAQAAQAAIISTSLSSTTEGSYA